MYIYENCQYSYFFQFVNMLNCFKFENISLMKVAMLFTLEQLNLVYFLFCCMMSINLPALNDLETLYMEPSGTMYLFNAQCITLVFGVYLLKLKCNNLNIFLSKPSNFSDLNILDFTQTFYEENENGVTNFRLLCPPEKSDCAFVYNDSSILMLHDGTSDKMDLKTNGDNILGGGIIHADISLFQKNNNKLMVIFQTM